MSACITPRVKWVVLLAVTLAGIGWLSTPAEALRPVEEFPVFTTFLRGITRGPDGNVWFADGGGNKIGRITPGGTITEFQTPT
ncbi:MAG TPA: hypothetical protein VGX21_08180, partial [Methylomirabilota bacterium]|nr:hypothetical protein [Methylomirabilota bacterium]